MTKSDAVHLGTLGEVTSGVSDASTVKAFSETVYRTQLFCFSFSQRALFFNQFKT